MSSKYILLAVLVASLWLVEMVELSPLLTVVEKLDAYALNATKVSSGLTLKEISQASDEWKKMPEDIKEKSNNIPLVKLAVDFVVRPMGVAGLQIENRASHIGKYVQRAERAYRLFRPAYLGKQFSGDLVKAGKFFKILHTVEGKRPRDKLTTKDFLMAKAEYEGWQAVLDEKLNYEDVYGSIAELKKIFNFFNDVFVKAISTGVYPYVKKDSTVDELLNLFLEELKVKYDIYWQKGKWIKLVSKVTKQSVSSGKADDTPLRDEEPALAELSAPIASPEEVEEDEVESSSAATARSGGWRLSAPEEEAYL